MMSSGCVVGQMAAFRLWSLWVCGLVIISMVNGQCAKFEFPTANMDTTKEAILTLNLHQNVSIPFTLDMQNCSLDKPAFTVTVSKMNPQTKSYSDVCYFDVDSVFYVKSFRNDITCRAESNWRSFSLSKHVVLDDETSWKWKTRGADVTLEKIIRIHLNRNPSLSTSSSAPFSPIPDPASTLHPPRLGDASTPKSSISSTENYVNDNKNDNDNSADDEDTSSGLVIAAATVCIVVISLLFVCAYLLLKRYRTRGMNGLCKTRHRSSRAQPAETQEHVHFRAVPRNNAGQEGQRRGGANSSHIYSHLFTAEPTPDNVHDKTKDPLYPFPSTPLPVPELEEDLPPQFLAAATGTTTPTITTTTNDAAPTSQGTVHSADGDMPTSRAWSSLRRFDM